jgi:hypothetical protein
MSDTTHKCPARRCTLRVGPGKLMCRTHWYMVPGPLRDAVYAAWANGAGAEAILAAVEAVNAKLAGS